MRPKIVIEQPLEGAGDGGNRPTEAILPALEARYGVQEVTWPTEPFAFLVWWHCGYPPSDAACARGWTALTRCVAISPEALLQASQATLAAALKMGGMVPDLRAQRLKEIAARVQDAL